MENSKTYPLWHPVYWLCTWGHCGLSPKAPGTVGSLLALPYAWVVLEYFGAQLLLIASIICFFIGWYVSELYVRKTGREDPKEVVIDEVAGMWLVLAAIGVFSVEVNLAYYLAAFILFRVFDIIKPWPVSWADKKIKGGFGIMLDDILAALYAIITVSYTHLTLPTICSV